MRDILAQIKEAIAAVGETGGSFFHNFIIALFGAVARFINDHRSLEPFSVQVVYGMVRAFIVSLVVVYWVEAVIECFRLVGPSGLAVALAAAYYAAEITEIIKSMLPSIVDKVKNMLERK